MFSPYPSHVVPAVALAAAALAVGGLVPTAAHAQPASATRLHVKVHAATLLVRGSAQEDDLVLRLRAGRPDVLEIDAGADGTADASAERDRFDRIRVDVRGAEEDHVVGP